MNEHDRWRQEQHQKYAKSMPLDCCRSLTAAGMHDLARRLRRGKRRDGPLSVPQVHLRFLALATLKRTQTVPNPYRIPNHDRGSTQLHDVR